MFVSAVHISSTIIVQHASDSSLFLGLYKHCFKNIEVLRIHKHLHCIILEFWQSLETAVIVISSPDLVAC